MSLSEIRAKLLAQETRAQSNQERSQGDNALFPFWNMAEGTSSVVRFLPDADPNNSFFWVEKSMFKLPFNGVKGTLDNKQHIVQVPCVEMYGESCPILAEVRTWYKDESLKETANKYWKKRTYLFQGFVRQNSLADDKAPENPIRRFVITPQIFQIIKASLMDPEIEEMPTDYTRGLDFNIKKASKGGYADYSTSGWARKESTLTAAEHAAIDQHGLFTLREFLPKKPSEAEQRIIREMFEASVDGRPYDPERWAAYYKPWGLNVGGEGRGDSDVAESQPAPRIQVPVSRPAPTVAAETSETPPWEDEAETVSPQKTVTVSQPVTKPAGSDKAQDILAMIRSRQTNKVA